MDMNYMDECNIMQSNCIELLRTTNFEPILPVPLVVPLMHTKLQSGRATGVSCSRSWLLQNLGFRLCGRRFGLGGQLTLPQLRWRGRCLN